MWGIHEKPLTYRRLRVFRLFNDNKRTPTAGKFHSGDCDRYASVVEKSGSSANSEERPSLVARGGAYFGKRMVKARVIWVKRNRHLRSLWAVCACVPSTALRQ